jgi:putative methionine-R-sulfoxide reductase with GAF domain
LTQLGALADRMGYRHLSLLIVEGDRLRVGAARGFTQIPESLAIGQGIVGRVARTGTTTWARDVRADPDYLDASPGVRSEIAVPLRADGQILGVLDIEADEGTPLTERDVTLAEAVAERVSSALLLGREQQALAQRVQLLRALSEFARATNAILEPDRLAPALMEALTQIFPGDVMTLTTLDRETGKYQITAARGVAESSIGVEVPPGDGPAGRAIAAGPSSARSSCTGATTPAPCATSSAPTR